jgi:hypothetical protein
MTRVVPFYRAWLREKERTAELRLVNRELRRESAVAKAHAAIAWEEAAGARAQADELRAELSGLLDYVAGYGTGGDDPARREAPAATPAPPTRQRRAFTRSQAQTARPIRIRSLARK